MKAAGVRRFGEPVQVLELPGSLGLRPDEVLIEIRACGVGNWDEFARTGDRVREVKAGDRVTAHSVPLREQGAWAERFPLERAAAALELARHGAHGAAIVLWPADPALARLGQDSQPALAWF
jgi:NADPH:quinone reductase-like Zn-dependent oxidoreductase